MLLFCVNLFQPSITEHFLSEQQVIFSFGGTLYCHLDQLDNDIVESKWNYIPLHLAIWIIWQSYLNTPQHTTIL